MLKKSFVIGALALAAASSQADTLLQEGFDNVAGLTGAGWVQTNLSSPVGLGWGQGFVGPFGAQSGPVDSYAVANFESAAFGSGGVIDNWLITPTLTFDTSNTLSFWTRTIFNPSIFPDRLEARLSTAGSSTATSNFTTTLASVNPDLTGTGYPNVWTQYSVSFAAIAGTTGRLAFRYTVPNSSLADFIGLDSVTVTAVPEPGTWALMWLGLGAVAALARRRTLR